MGIRRTQEFPGKRRPAGGMRSGSGGKRQAFLPGGVDNRPDIAYNTARNPHTHP